ncbi:hypothetical protein NQZ68_017466 [Dissostichus eleginoides]|nr:hypothetical protein NQZ68_017466 [Dissostichus eleginoides]
MAAGNKLYQAATPSPAYLSSQLKLPFTFWHTTQHQTGPRPEIKLKAKKENLI